MSKCKNPECLNEPDGEKIYCSLKCRNIYVNKYLRDYNINKEGFQKIKDKLIIQYLKNPKYCKYCKNEIPFEKRRNSYCNSSCMATDTNKLRKGMKLNISEKGRKSLQECAIKNFSNELERKNYYENPTVCLNCNKEKEFGNRKRVFCNLKCKKEFYSKNIENYTIYYFLTKFKFKFKDFEKEFDFSLIKKYGWYKAKNRGNNMTGISRDHMFSVKEGFRRLINPLLLAHPINCKLMLQNENSSKCDKCSITLDELLKRIQIFDNKYGKYYKEDLKTYIELNELKELYNGGWDC